MRSLLLPVSTPHGQDTVYDRICDPATRGCARVDRECAAQISCLFFEQPAAKLQNVIGANDSDDVDDGDETDLTRLVLFNDGLQCLIDVNDVEFSLHHLIDTRAHQHEDGVILADDEAALDEFDGHDGIAAAEADEPIGDHDGDDKGEDRVGIVAEFAEEDDAGEGYARNVTKDSGHGYERIESRVAEETRKEMLAGRGVGRTESSANNEGGRKDAAGCA